ncbi:MAG: PEGA domain-containing protein [Pseudomonadales bacterium]|jgi:hypothetical protein|nr:PEGA domain-containing protein [Pseudomonadales bacterium]
MSKTSLIIIIGCAIIAVLGFFIQTHIQDRQHWGGIFVDNTGIPTRVWLNNLDLGDAPLLNEKLEPGRHSLRLIPEDDEFAPLEIEIFIHSRNLTVINWYFDFETGGSYGLIYQSESASDGEKIIINSIPDRALISFGGQEQPEFAPLEKTNLPLGLHNFTISLPGHNTLEGSLQLSRNQRITIIARLIPTNPDETDSSGINENDQDDKAQLSLQILPTNYYENDQEVLRVRGGPGSEFDQVGSLPVGAIVPHLDVQEGDWYKIDFEGQEGWINIGFATLLDEPNTDTNNSASEI